jgi:acetolactate synthase I/II/III large subunit
MKASDLFVKALENEGVKYVFGIPGEENLDLLESLRKSKIKFIITRHEQGAGFMAATYGRLTGKTGVCLSTLGPGATNFFTSVSYAFLGGMPVLFITGQKPIKKSKQGRFQIIDIVGSMRPITKFTRQIVNGNNIPHLIRECFRLAESEKPGPVHLELPEDVSSEEVDRNPFLVTKVEPPRARLNIIKMAGKMISEAERPLLLIASGANRGQNHIALKKLIDKSGIFFFTTQMGKGTVDERHPRCLGTAAISENDYIHCAIDRADLIINVGHDLSEKPPFFMKENGQKVIHISSNQATMDDIYFPHLEVVGCLKTNLSALANLLEPSKRWDFKYFKKVKDEMDLHLFKKDQTKSFPNIPQRIVSDVREVMPPNGILSLDNGMYKLWFARNYRAFEPNTVLLDNALASMGAGLPCAIGAKLVFPKRDVLAICGDGGFLMNSQELETAVRLKLDLVIVVLRDNGYGMIKWKQGGMNFPSFGLDFSNPDFVKFANAFGAKGRRISKTGELTKVLKEAFKQGGVHLIEVPIDYSENEKVFMEELKNRTCLI